MNKSEAIKIFLSNPIKTIIRGIQSNRSEYYKNNIKTKYNIEKLPSIELFDLFPDLNDELGVFSYQPGTSGVLDHLLLRQIAKQRKECHYLEIGSLRGESLANVSQVAKECTSVSLGPKQMMERGFSSNLIEVVNLFSKGLKNVQHIEADSTVFDFSTLNKKYDLIFVDGDHSYNGVLNDTQKVMDLRKDSNSVIVWHDYSDNTEDVGYEVFNGILDGIPAEKHKNLFHVSNTLCAIYMENMNHSTYFSRSYMMPNKNFHIKVSASKL